MVKDEKQARFQARMRWLAERSRGAVVDIGCSRSLLGPRVLEEGCTYVGLDLDAAAVLR